MPKANLKIAKAAVAEQKDDFVTDVDFQELYEAIGISFAGTETIRPEPTMDFVTSHIDFDDLESKQKLITFLMGFTVDSNTTRKHHLTLAKKQDDEIKSVINIVECNARRKLVIEMIAEKLAEKPREMALVMRLMKQQGGFPELFTSKECKEDNKKLMEKLDAVGETFKLHKKYGPKGYHWYISHVGVSPEAQGKGLGGELMRKVSELADAQGVDCYLETGSESNRAFYERYGYQVVGEEVFSDKEGSESIKMYFMLRPGQSVESQ